MERYYLQDILNLSFSHFVFLDPFQVFDLLTFSKGWPNGDDDVYNDSETVETVEDVAEIVLGVLVLDEVGEDEEKTEKIEDDELIHNYDHPIPFIMNAYIASPHCPHKLHHNQQLHLYALMIFENDRQQAQAEVE